ncbi:MAG: radical SAM peptide maturase [Marinifilaceae bacterium]
MKKNIFILKDRYLYNSNQNSLLYTPKPMLDLLKRDPSHPDPKSDQTNSDEAVYYSRKINFLKKHGLLDLEASEPEMDTMKPEIIANELANIQQILFEVTDACNLKCKYCGYGEFYGNHDDRESKFLQMNEVEKLFQYLIPYLTSPQNLSIDQPVFISFYGGEPLLNIKLIKSVVSYIENLDLPHLKFVYSMTTNGILLDKEIDYLVEKKFHLLISLDGNEYNNSYRVDHQNQNSFPKLFRNIQHVKNTYTEYFEKYIEFNSVLHNRNSVEELTSFIHNEFNKIPIIGELNTSGIAKEKQEEFNRMYKEENESLLSSKHPNSLMNKRFLKASPIKNLGIFLYERSNNFFHDYNDLITAGKKQKKLPTGTCVPFSKKIFVTVNGRILPCERIGHNFTLGNITDKGVEMDLEQIADKYNNYYRKLNNQCSQCYNISKCGQCIFNIENLETKPICKDFIIEKSMAHYLSEQISLMEEKPELYSKITKELIFQ